MICKNCGSCEGETWDDEYYVYFRCSKCGNEERYDKKDEIRS